MPYAHDDEDLDAATLTRRRQAGQLEHINTYYQLRERLGVTAAIGGRVRFAGRQGAIVDTAGQYLRVLCDGDTEPVTCHATSDMAYQSPTGWVQSTPLPDPYATPSTAPARNAGAPR